MTEQTAVTLAAEHNRLEAEREKALRRDERAVAESYERSMARIESQFQRADLDINLYLHD